MPTQILSSVPSSGHSIDPHAGRRKGGSWLTVMTVLLGAAVAAVACTERTSLEGVLALCLAGALLTTLFTLLVRAQSRSSRRAESALAQTLHGLEVYRAAVDQHSIVVTTDAQGIITSVNDLFCRVSGYDRDELIGSPHRLLCSGHHPPEFWAELWRTIESGRIWHGEIRNRRKDGSHYWVDTSISPIFDLEGSIAGYCAVRTDITGLKNTQEELEKAWQAADAANMAKSAFLANMSHEIRTPLTSILGYTELLAEAEENGEEIPAAERGATLRTVRTAGEHLLAIINDILDLSKIEAGHMTIEQLPLSLPRLLGDIEQLIRRRAASKGVELRIRLQDAVPTEIEGDPTRLRQILMNLLGNAVKFTQDGFIEVRVRSIATAKGPRLRIEVEDTGPGMTTAQTRELFRPFTQGDDSISRKHGGTGLGLTICRRLTELMDGAIWIERSEPGVGSCFAVELPLRPIPGTAPCLDLRDGSVPEREAMPPTKTRIPLEGRVLLAEDGIDTRRLIAHLLSKAGAEVCTADNGRVAFEMITAARELGEPFDLLVTDMQMPELDGYGLAARLRADGDAIPVLALTAHAMSEDRQRCLDAGCDAYASKPIERQAFLGACAKLLARDRART